ncbi:MAG: quinone-dependent dihydroorotate dehydrogenase [Nanoarchaeota archaeon]
MSQQILIRIRNTFEGAMYRAVVKKICFTRDAEQVHNFFINKGQQLGDSQTMKKMISLAFNYHHPYLEQTLLSLNFKNPVGLSAGFDKNAQLLNILPQIGFGFAEVGSITALPCAGNPGTRLARLPQQQSLWVNLGLNNHGAEAIASHLQKVNPEFPFGISIAKTNCQETCDPLIGIEDYLTSLKIFSKHNIGCYYTLNVSCPNAYGGQPFHEPQLYEKLLKQVAHLHIKKPLFVKLSPDIQREKIDKIISLSQKYGIVGFICTNLTKKHSKEQGGISGKAVEEGANDLLKYAAEKTRGKSILIGVGGIFSAEDAYKKIKLGAHLVQLITGMIYQGPQLISEINQGLVNLLKKDGYSSISQAVGIDTYNKK